MEYNEVKRVTPFKGDYKYKAHLKLSVYWTEDTEIWNNSFDEEYAKKLDQIMDYFHKGNFIRQGAVIYCKSIDEIYRVRIYCDDKIIKIEKALV